MHTIVNNTKISSYILIYLLKYSLKISLRQSIVGKIGASVRDVTAELDTTATQSCTDQRSQRTGKSMRFQIAPGGPQK